MDVSIVIVNWNTKDILADCLESIFQQTKAIGFEVIVIDNASADGSAEMVRKDFGQVILLENSRNAGFAVANNQGISISKGRYVLLLNSDTIILDDAIDRAVSFADKHTEAAVTGCRVLNPDGSLQPTCFMFPSLLNQILFTSYLYRLFPQSRFFGRERMTWWDRNSVQEVDVVTGCFMLVRRYAIAQVGMMDERFFVYGEEVDWCYRFGKAGWTNLFTPEAGIIHLGGASAAGHSDRRALIFDESLVRLMFKHWPRWKAKTGVWLMGLFYLSRLFVLVPANCLRPGDDRSALICNHKTGFKGLLRYQQYLKFQS